LTPSPVPLRDRRLSRAHRFFSAVSTALGILFAPTFAQYASRHPGVPAWKLARRRIVAMHAALVALETVPTGMPAIVGAIIDQHLPLLQHRPKCMSVFAVYRSKLAPEMSTAYDCDFAATETMVANLWGRADDHGSFRRLLLKGGPFPTSVRYVSAQLERTAIHPSTADAVTRLLRLSLLGAYPHSRVIAPPRVRKEIHARTGVELLQYFAATAGRSSYHYFYLVAEFVMAATRRSPQLWHWVLSHARYVEYERLVSAAADMIRRNERPPRIPPALTPRTWDLGASTVGFVAAAGGNRKLTPAVQLAYTPGRIHREFAAALLSGRWGFAGDLMLLDPASPRLQAVVDAKTEFDQRQAIQSLTPIEATGAQVVAHAVAAKIAVSVGAVTQGVAHRQEQACRSRTGTPEYVVIVCIACATWRSKAAVAGISRGSVGVRVLLPLGRGVVCNACQQTVGIRYVNLVGAVLRIRPRADVAPVQISICTGCGAPASGLVRRGGEWMCPTCLKDYAPRPFHRPGCFVCGSAGVAFAFMARHNGRLVHATACTAHRPRVPGVVNAEIAALARMVSNRRHRYIRRWARPSTTASHA